MSLYTRLLGFALAVAGAFLAGYYQELHSAGATIAAAVNEIAQTIPGYAPVVVPQVTSYVQENIEPVWIYYVVVGVAVLLVGVFLVARGDGRPVLPQRQAPLQSQPVAVKQKE